jgi:hypothetical protein
VCFNNRTPGELSQGRDSGAYLGLVCGYTFCDRLSTLPDWLSGDSAGECDTLDQCGAYFGLTVGDNGDDERGVTAVIWENRDFVWLSIAGKRTSGTTNVST